MELGVNPQAWAVLQGLAYYGVGDQTVDAYAWYNGRERGVVLVKTTRSAEIFCVAFAECRNSDAIVIYNWEGSVKLNPPTIEDVPQEAWDNVKSFSFLRVDQAARFINKLLDKADKA